MSAEEQEQRGNELLGAGALLVRLPPPTAHVRGHLGSLLEELVERELARAGAPAPYLAAWTAMPDEANARLADQLVRAHEVGASGLAIALGTLAAIAQPSLSTDDSAVLRWLAEGTTALPLVLLIDDSDMLLTGYAAPRSLVDLVVQTRHDSEPPVVLTGDDATNIESAIVVSIDVSEAIVAAAVVEDEAPVTEPEALPIVEAATPEPEAEPIVEAAAPEPERAVEPEPEPAPEPAQTILGVAPPAPEPVTIAPPARNGRRARAARAAIAGAVEAGPSDAWRSCALALSAARGAQPLAAFEKLFAESYVPLANAIAGGLEDPRALRAFEEFRRSFERSYTDAFTTFGATNRRPRLVMDAFDIANKQARLANARSAHILVVDSMRYDLGCMVRDALAREAAGVASLGSETLLWSALPTTTMRQLETLARGLDALRAPAEAEPSESLRGRAAEVVRRCRVGSREIHKLDLVPALLDAAGANAITELPNIAEQVAEAIARHVTTLVPRTLLFVVGDHGFSVDRRGHVQSGGASPEEVLVPAQSWLIGDLH